MTAHRTGITHPDLSIGRTGAARPHFLPDVPLGEGTFVDSERHEFLGLRFEGFEVGDVVGECCYRV